MQMFAGLDASAAPHRSDRSEVDVQAWIALRDRIYREAMVHKALSRNGKPLNAATHEGCRPSTFA
jgi:hypothetical protein